MTNVISKSSRPCSKHSVWQTVQNTNIFSCVKQRRVKYSDLRSWDWRIFCIITEGVLFFLAFHRPISWQPSIHSHSFTTKIVLTYMVTQILYAFVFDSFSNLPFFASIFLYKTGGGIAAPCWTIPSTLVVNQTCYSMACSQQLIGSGVGLLFA